VFRLLRIPVAIHINNRKILSALATLCGGEDLMAHITVAIDKLDKIGPEKVKDELIGKGLSMEQVERVEHYMSIQGDTLQRLQQLDELFAEVPIGKEGIGELRQVLELSQSNDQAECIVDPTLARGLNYYTGSIFEIKAKGIEMGSIGGGGRYDDLTGLFGVKGIPGVGISFGVDRIYDVMEELTLFPDHIHSGTKALIFRTSEHELRYQMDLAAVLRKNGIACELFHELVKFDKQFKYAERKGIPYVIIAGSEEMKKTTYLVKNLALGEQREYALEQLISMLIA
jgi:histidyl-tRNA synthetase